MDADEHTEPHFDHAVLLVIDVQADFVDGGASPVAGTTETLPLIRRLLDAFRRSGLPIVHVVRLYANDDVDRVRRAHIAAGSRLVHPGSAGSELAGGLTEDRVVLDHERLLGGGVQRLGPDEHVLFKPRWSAFFRTSLDDRLRSTGVDTVVVTGCNFPNCPRATLFDASSRDYRAVVVSDAVSGIDGRHLAEMASIGVVAASSDEVAGAVLGPHRRQPPAERVR